MKQFKLIKTFPGSKPLNSVFTESEKYLSLLKCENGGTYILKSHIINYPEYWEEVQEASEDYEILSFRCITKDTPGFGQLLKLQQDGNYSWEYHLFAVFSLKSVLSAVNAGHQEIYSVKRLSDGEVFTVGDDIIEQNEHSKIEYFELRGNWLMVRINHQITKGSSTIMIDSNFQKYIPKQPLFTTEDGVDIFKGDRCWAGNRGSLLLTDYVHAIFQGNDKSRIYFDNLTRLEKYIASLNTKVIKEETVSHKIVSFGPNPTTGGIYTFNKHTNKYHSDISQARIPYKECFRYPVRSVTNTEKNFFKRGDCVSRLDTKSNPKYDIIYFEPVKKKKIIYAHISTRNTRARLIKINIDNLEHFVEE